MQMDIQKAYDTLDWNALEKILNELGFPKKFTKWIITVVSTVSYRFNFNGNYTDIMEGKLGLIQGDPISPMLFVVVMECLNRYLYSTQKDRNYNYHPKCEKLEITNLCFAYDLLVFSRGDKIYLEMMMSDFNKFSKATGLVVNMLKCILYCVGVDREVKQDIFTTNGFYEGQLPFKYLCVHVIGNKLDTHNYMLLIDRFMGIIKHWTARMLSYAGRVQLIKSVTFALINYWLQCFPFPKSVLHKIESIFHIFLWTGGFKGVGRHPLHGRRCVNQNFMVD